MKLRISKIILGLAILGLIIFLLIMAFCTTANATTPQTYEEIRSEQRRLNRENIERRDQITYGVDSLRELGLEITWVASRNELCFADLCNASLVIHGALIAELRELNEQNQENSARWRVLNEQARRVVRIEWIGFRFPAREQPCMDAPIVARFCAQYVRVLERRGDFWRICTYRGNLWVNPNQPERRWTYYDVDVLSRMVWGEARGISRNGQMLTVWTVLNRLDRGFRGVENGIPGIVRSAGQFVGYRSWQPVTPEIRDVVIEVLEAWDRGEPALVYPPYATCPHYLYFRAWTFQGRAVNRFRTAYAGYHCHICNPF